MAEHATQIAPDVLKRRSTRIARAVPLRVTGVDALGRSFEERTCASIISCHGGRYQSKYYVYRSEWVMLEIPCCEAGLVARRVRGRVRWIQRPRVIGEPFHFGVELEIAGNFWGIAGCPPDWFPFPDGAKPTAPPIGIVPASAPLEASVTWRGTAITQTFKERTKLGPCTTLGNEESSDAPLRF